MFGSCSPYNIRSCVFKGYLDRISLLFYTHSLLSALAIVFVWKLFSLNDFHVAIGSEYREY